jgi:hypothetical protein
MHSRHLHRQSSTDTQRRGETGYSTHLGEELEERAAPRTAAAPVQLLLRIKAIPGEEELDGILLPVVLSLRHLHHSLPCTHTDELIPKCFLLEACIHPKRDEKQ